MAQQRQWHRMYSSIKILCSIYLLHPRSGTENGSQEFKLSLLSASIKTPVFRDCHIKTVFAAKI